MLYRTLYQITYTRIIYNIFYIQIWVQILAKHWTTPDSCIYNSTHVTAGALYECLLECQLEYILNVNYSRQLVDQNQQYWNLVHSDRFTTCHVYNLLGLQLARFTTCFCNAVQYGTEQHKPIGVISYCTDMSINIYDTTYSNKRLCDLW
jgi:hypothetical protein